jgi:4-hydroxy-tetrahydrodipicolinate reductase
VPILIGTTGLDDLASRRIAEASRSVAVLRASNTSLGVALLEELVERAARVLETGWDVEVLEMHHRLKRDAPSGTALTLGEAAARRDAASRCGRKRSEAAGSWSGEEGAIGFAALRGGTVVGDHDVIFAGPEERLILSHRAESRMIFARGALAGARFLAGSRRGSTPCAMWWGAVKKAQAPSSTCACRAQPRAGGRARVDQPLHLAGCRCLVGAGNRRQRQSRDAKVVQGRRHT